MSISEEIRPLAAEARKHNTASDFVSAIIKKRNYFSTQYTTQDEEYAFKRLYPNTAPWTDKELTIFYNRVDRGA